MVTPLIMPAHCAAVSGATQLVRSAIRPGLLDGTKYRVWLLKPTGARGLPVVEMVGNWVVRLAGEIRWSGTLLRFQATSPWKRILSVKS